MIRPQQRRQFVQRVKHLLRRRVCFPRSRRHPLAPANASASAEIRIGGAATRANAITTASARFGECVPSGFLSITILPTVLIRCVTCDNSAISLCRRFRFPLMLTILSGSERPLATDHHPVRVLKPAPASATNSAPSCSRNSPGSAARNILCIRPEHFRARSKRRHPIAGRPAATRFLVDLERIATDTGAKNRRCRSADPCSARSSHSAKAFTTVRRNVAALPLHSSTYRPQRHAVHTERSHPASLSSNILRTVVKAFALCDDVHCTDLHYDSDGLGAGVRGDALKINEERVAAGRPAIRVTAFRASAEVFRPDAQDVSGRRNRDYFANKKAQSWWQMRRRFEYTHRVVVGGERPFDPDRIVSISGNLKAPAQADGRVVAGDRIGSTRSARS